ncbi:MAG: hypothetical protein A3H72_03715 [Candidatus Doudnabacteria bacterium RIFCSPLOWO2_02_FULL_48_8]|uniref:Polymerase beta nucleotidyltransferase domain-containing protein n=1 Tax=Candidatus Doudnabacteria bacterium RIFCSPHIGHO2_01_FULL_46_24 TaxID=1817825 RepID=A0A1F5NU10_9BACT|nr:MAG: hypothetical protein A2720_03965 [Candidatus Doudnabacteria bacterium RIFCSPHIGHO2_01_FULL_46_24]OGE95490.1 MAG: hypothetical protein A3H72_03715 [Candidatus Doudnabacteria bacterium RIFCSPLOWO2_02_FULL_48_8]OGE95896.1 MAG: hypothetical protein A3E98_03975 [Candidatus Doudnabacteria bacterium RIFCSPHIGHO2_12_FULL_48_11]
MRLEEVKAKITPVLQQSGVEYAGVFGSLARGQDRPDSDVDLLVRFQELPGLFGYIRLERRLSEVLGKKVDLATEESLHPMIKGNVLSELKPVYEK